MSRLLFWGTDQFSARHLEELIKSEFEVVAVITQPDRRRGRSGELKAPEVKVLAQKHNIPVLQPDKLDSSFTEKLKSYQADLGVLVSYGRLVPAEIINRFPAGIVNVHASLLPRWRGASPIEAAIVNGDRMTGVSLMRLCPGLDNGPVYTQAVWPLYGKTTRPQLYQELAELGAKTLLGHLDDIVAQKIEPTPQDERQATHAGIIKKSDGIINWSKPAQRLEQEIRGYLGWPGSPTELGGKDVIITAARVAPGTGDPGECLMDAKHLDRPLFVYCGEDCLVIDKLIPVGKREMSGAEFVRGIRA